MIRNDLGSPKLRPTELRIRDYAYRTSRQIFLPTPSRLPRLAFFEAILKRRSRREFCDLSIIDLSAVLWFTCKTLEINHGSLGDWQHRCTPSAGGIHPIDILISTPAKSKGQVFIYEPISHSLKLLSGISTRFLEGLLVEMNEAIPIRRGTIFWFVAQFHKTLSKYKNGESLVWRDSGALMATFCAVAEALALNCCAIGPTGDPYISKMFGGTRKLRGVGGCLVGRRSKRSQKRF